MKKLKKGLSLLLVLAMVFSLATTAFAGWDVSKYEDADKITQDEAVAVLSGLGIIEGDETTGNLNPDKTYTRAAAAKVLTYMLIGPENAEALPDTSSKFTDVETGKWYTGVINYLAEQGIVSGYGDGRFGPDKPVTQDQWLKMLLCAMGYDEEKAGMGDTVNWAVNARSLAMKKGLVTAAQLKLDWNRETAILNAYTAITLNKNLADSEDTDPVFAVTVNSAKSQTDAVSDKKTGNDAYGRPVTYYSTSTQAKAYAISTDEPELVIENGSMTNAKLLEALGLEDSEKANVDVTIYEDGKKTDAAEALNTSGKFETSVGAYGQTVEIYNTTPANAEHNTYTFVVINTYAAKIGEIAEGDTTVDLLDVNDQKITTPVGDLKEGDVVSFNVCEDITTSATDYIAENVTVLEGTEGKITATVADNAYVRVDGEKVYASEKISGGITGKTAVTSKETLNTTNVPGKATFYYDVYGNILYVADPAEEEPEEAAEYDGYIYVTADGTYAEGSGSDAFGDRKAPTETLKVVDVATGETASVQRAIVYNATEKKYYYADSADGTASEGAQDASSDNNKISAAGFFGYYKLDDGSLVVEALTTTPTSQNDVVVATGKALVKSATENGYADANTELTYVVVSGEEGEKVYTTKTVTGIANFPTITSAEDSDISWAVVAEDDVIEKIFVVTTNGETVTPVAGNKEEPATVYGVYKSTGEYNVAEKTYAYTFVVDGVETVYYGKSNVDFETKGANVVYVITVDGDGYLTTTATAAFSGETLVSADVLGGVADSYVIESTGDVVYKADTCTVYDATEEQCGLVKGATVDLCLDGSGNVVYIVITAKPASAS
jgi:hypothetical protein